jgi:hypothetical protein
MVSNKRIVVNWKHPPNPIFNAGPEWDPVTSSQSAILEKCIPLVALLLVALVVTFDFIPLLLRHFQK